MLSRISMKWRVALLAGLVFTVMAVQYAIDYDHRPAIFTPFDGGFGTLGSPWEISTSEQLIAIGSEDRYLRGSYVLTTDIEWSPNDAVGFAGIGSEDPTIPHRPSFRSFTGTFDGRGHEIRGLTLRGNGQDRVGLFRRSEGTIKNLTLTKVDVDAPNDSSVAGLVASNHGVVSAVRVEGDIRGDRNIGAVVAYNGVDGQVTEATSTGRAVGNVGVGGLVGENWGVVKDSSSSADVDGGYLSGGLVGRNRGRITASVATGGVHGTNSVGGLTGGSTGSSGADNTAATIEHSLSTGPVTGHRSVGGLIGTLSDATVVESQSDGDVSGTTNVGGLVGAINDTGRVVACEASGAVVGGNSVAGLVGWNAGEVVDSLATGSVEGKDDVGGFLGNQRFRGTTGRSVSTSSVRGVRNTGGFAATVDDSRLVQDSYWNVDSSGVGDSAAGTGVSDAQFSDPETFAGFSFCPGEECRWKMNEKLRRPVLVRQSEPVFETP